MRVRRGRIGVTLAIPWLLLALVWQPATAARKPPGPEPGPPGERMVDLALRDSRAVDTVFTPALAEEGPGGKTWSTRLAGQPYTGVLVSDSFVLGTDLRVPVLGSAADGNVLRLWIHAPEGAVLHQIAYDPTPAGVWTLDTRRWLGRRGRLALEDGRADPAGWLGIGAPSVWVRPDPRTPTYGQFAIALGIVLALVLVPGLALCQARPESALLHLLVPLPGLLLLAAFGAALWLFDAGGDQRIGRVYVGLILLLVAWSLLRRRCSARSPTAHDRWPHALWGAAFATALLVGINPLPVASEYDAHTSLPGRMVASPPDHQIPYWTAVYFHHGHGGSAQHQAYFGGWGLCGRGPLVPWAINGLFTVLGAEPSDPPVLDTAHWPLAADGAYLARILGWLTNALVVLGAARLLGVLGVGRRATVLTLAWLTLAPVTLIHVVFLWPKLLAGFFTLLAAADLLEGRPRRAGIWGALGWLSHPVGALYLVPLGLAALHLGLRSGQALRSALALAGSVLVVMSPWLTLKIALGQSDPFLAYLLGDGRTLERALSTASWLNARWANLWYTVVPGAFYAEGCMRHWIDGPLSDPLRWTVQYAKTLPGHLGFSLFLAAYAALLRRHAASRVRVLQAHLLGSALLVMLVFWGYSADGLGRNSLEPLSVLVIALTAPWWGERTPRWALPALIALCGEGAWITLSGTLGSPGFALSLMTPAAWVLTVASLVPPAAVVHATARRLRQPSHHEPRPRPAESEQDLLVARPG